MTAITSEKNTMTARRFFTEIQTYDLPAELLDYAANEIQKLDDAKEKRKEKPTKAQRENAVIRERPRRIEIENEEKIAAQERQNLVRLIGGQLHWRCRAEV